MVERDIEEKQHIKSLLQKLTGLSIIVAVIGFLLILAFGVSIYVSALNKQSILINRESAKTETRINREYGVKLIQKIDSTNAILYKK